MKAIKIKALLCIMIICMQQGLLGQYNIDSINRGMLHSILLLI
jgi:hypothetical protein